MPLGVPRQTDGAFSAHAPGADQFAPTCHHHDMYIIMRLTSNPPCPGSAPQRGKKTCRQEITPDSFRWYIVQAEE